MGPLRVQLLGMGAATLLKAKQQWAQLVAKVTAPASVVVMTDYYGVDLLAD